MNSSGVKKTLGASFLIGGTAIGAGMLALPLATATSGFIPAVFLYLICWAFSVFSGFLMVEAVRLTPEDSNLITMSQALIGPIGKACAWILYLFLFYLLIIAYVSGGGKVVASFLSPQIPNWVAILTFAIFFGFFVFLGVQAVDRLNQLMMVGLLASFIAFLVLGIPHVQIANLQMMDFAQMFPGLPVIFLSFSYQGVLPSVTHYLKGNTKQIKAAILLGTSMPFLAYLLWDALIKGSVSVEALVTAKEQGFTAIEPLRYIVAQPSFFLIAELFGFFALVTSFLGVSLALVDFLADGFNLSKTPTNKAFLTGVIFLPAVVIAATNPTIFFKAFRLAGGLGGVLLLGFMPIWMVYRARYVLKETQGHKPLLFGGKAMLGLLTLFIAFELYVTFFWK